MRITSRPQTINNSEDSEHHASLQSFDYPVPAHANTVLYMFGGITLSAFAIMIISGIYLSQFYSASPKGSYASVVSAITNVPLADFSRSLHWWTANLIIGLLLFHIVRVFITGSYKKPRRLTWLTGVALLGITVLYIFTGSTLKLDQEAVEAVGHLQESFQLFGVTLGLTNGNVPLIVQLYSWHTMVLTLGFMALIVLHMVLIKLRGISPLPRKNKLVPVAAMPHVSSFFGHLRRLVGFSALFAALAALLAVALPAPLGYPGILGSEVTTPLWMFWPFYGLENIFGLKGLVYGLIGFFVILMTVPFIDRNPYQEFAKRKLILVLGAVFSIVVVGLGIYSQVAPPKAHLDEEMATSDSSMPVEVARADTITIPRTRIRSEATFIVPLAVVVGATGAWAAYYYRPKTTRTPNGPNA